MTSPLAIVTRGLLGRGRTYLAGGTEIEVIAAPNELDIAAANPVAIEALAQEIDISGPAPTLDVVNDGIDLDL